MAGASHAQPQAVRTNVAFSAALKRKVQRLRKNDRWSRGLTALVRHPNADQLGLGRAYAIWPTGTARSSACPVARLERWMRVPARGRGRHRQRLAACPTHG